MEQSSEIRLHEGELNVMELLWSNKSLAAKDIADIINEYIGWKKNTTYTVINRLIAKGAVSRQDPGFICKANISKRTAQRTETKALMDKLFNGSYSTFFNEFLRYQSLSASEILELQRIISENQTNAK
jgi:predicted transcriptional regulator